MGGAGWGGGALVGGAYKIFLMRTLVREWAGRILIEWLLYHFR